MLIWRSLDAATVARILRAVAQRLAAKPPVKNTKSPAE